MLLSARNVCVWARAGIVFTLVAIVTSPLFFREAIDLARGAIGHERDHHPLPSDADACWNRGGDDSDDI